MFEMGKSIEISKIFCPILLGPLKIVNVTVSSFRIPGINFE